MAYDNQCGSCFNFKDMKSDEIFFDKNNPNYIKGHCIWYKAFYYPDDSCNHYRSREGSSSSNCYLTTVICNRLGYSDDCEAMEVLRGFRGNVLQKDHKYASILFEYDTVGPRIARCLEKEDISLVEKLYYSYIEPIVTLIKSNNKDESIRRYIQMTNSLKDYYAISSDQELDKDYDYTSGGHGSLKILSLKNKGI